MTAPLSLLIPFNPSSAALVHLSQTDSSAISSLSSPPATAHRAPASSSSSTSSPSASSTQRHHHGSSSQSTLTTPAPRTSHAPDLRMFELISPSNLLKIYKGCANCRTQKIKCNGQEPCARCRAFGLQCQYIVLPNQAAHRLAALAAATAYSPDSTAIAASPTAAASTSTSTPTGADITATAPITTAATAAASHSPSNTLPSPTLLIPLGSTPSSPSGSTSSTAFLKTRGSKKKSRATVPCRRADSQATRSPSPRSNSPSEMNISLPTTQQEAKNWTGQPNIILQTIIQAADPELFVYKDQSGLDGSAPDAERMRPLVQLYLRYSHPFQRLVYEHDPAFWKQLDEPMVPEVASIVYAMCTVGAIYRSKTPGTECMDKMVGYFLQRTLSLIETRPEDITTVKTMLILRNFYVATLRSQQGGAMYHRMLKIAEDIHLGEKVLKMATQSTWSKEEIIMRNTWRLLVQSETLEKLITLDHGPVDPVKDLLNPALDTRPDEIPHAKTPSGEIAYYHLGNLFKIFQYIAKIKLPISARDIHPVTTALNALSAWHNSLPKHMRINVRQGGSIALSPFASTLDLYYRLGHIILLNSLPPAVRSNPRGLGPRRESPMRLLATFANGITATVSDLVREPDLRNHCVIIGIRCLSEAATIQLSNSEEPDPALSTPAKVNLMKTLWCIRQFNLAVSSQAIRSALAYFDTAAKQATVPQRETPRTRTPSISAMSADSPTLSAPSRSGRELSLASDYSSSTASTREGSHMTVYETDDPEKERPHPTPVSPSQDGAAASLLALSLKSPVVGQRRQEENSSAFPPRDVAHISAVTSYRIPQRTPTGSAHEDDRSRSSSVAIFSPKLDVPGSAIFLECQGPSLQPSHGDEEYTIPHDSRYIRPSPEHNPIDISPLLQQSRTSAHSFHPGHAWHHRHNGLDEHSLDARRTHRNNLSDPRKPEQVRSPVERYEPYARQQERYGERHVSQRARQVHSEGIEPLRAQHRPSRSGDRSSGAVDYFGPPGPYLQQIDMGREADSQPLRLSTTTSPSQHPHHPHEQSPRTPLSAASDIDGYLKFSARYPELTPSPSTSTHHGYIRFDQSYQRDRVEMNSSLGGPGRSAFDGTETRVAEHGSSHHGTSQSDMGPEPSSIFVSCSGSHSDQVSYDQYSSYQQQHQHALSYRQQHDSSPVQASLVHADRHMISSRSGDGGRPIITIDTSRAGLKSPPPTASPMSPRSASAAMTSRGPTAADPRWVGYGSNGVSGHSLGPLSYQSPAGIGRPQAADLGIPSPMSLAGRKRPSISMYGSARRDNDSERGGHGGALDHSHSGARWPTDYNADPLHQDGAESARGRHREDCEGSSFLPRQYSSGEPVRSPLGLIQPGHGRHTEPIVPHSVYPEQYSPSPSLVLPGSTSSSPSTSRPPRPSPSSSRSPHPLPHEARRHDTQSSYPLTGQDQHYSYQSPSPPLPPAHRDWQRQHRPQHLHQRHPQDPRTSPLSTCPPLLSSSSSPLLLPTYGREHHVSSVSSTLPSYEDEHYRHQQETHSQRCSVESGLYVSPQRSSEGSYRGLHQQLPQQPQQQEQQQQQQQQQQRHHHHHHADHDYGGESLASTMEEEQLRRERDRDTMPPPSMIDWQGHGHGYGSGAVGDMDGEEKDPTGGLSELLRAPIRRKYQ